MTDKKLNLLQEIWKKGEEAWDELKMKRASKSLRVQAESDLLKLQDEVIKLEETFESKVLKAKEEKNWTEVRKAKLAIRLKEKELEEGVDLYKEFFDRNASEFLDD